MEPSQGEIILKPKMQELSSLFMTHRLSVVHALVKFRFMNIFHTVLELWPEHSLLYGIKSRGNNSKTKNARVVFLVHDTSPYCDVCTCEVS